MARFERHEATDDRLADRLGAATQQLRAALEREAVEIITKAQEQAESVEEAARQRAAEVEREARARADTAIAEADEATARAEEARTRADEEGTRAEEARTSQADRLARVLQDVDAMEERVRAMFGDVRRRLSGELEDIRPPAPGPQQDPVADPEPPAREDVRPDPAMSFSRPIPLSVATEVDAATERNPVLDDMMRAQLVNMAESGVPRAEAERFLGRFKLGESYLGMLDEIYSMHAGHGGVPAALGRRRRFKRRGT